MSAITSSESTGNPSVSLREITSQTFRTIIRLEVAEDQKLFVAPNVASIAEAYFEEKAWFRAIYDGEEPVGFLMVYIDPEKPVYFLWRLMIAAEHQRRGYGRAALQELFQHLANTYGASELRVSHSEGEGSPAEFYKKLGFEYTGEVEYDELIMKRAL